MKDFLSGIVKGLADQQESRRIETRKREDEELSRRKAVLDHVWQGVLSGDVSPDYYAQALKDSMAVGEALSGKRTSKKGIGAAFSGATESPITPFLEALMANEIPLNDDDPRTKVAPVSVAPPPRKIDASIPTEGSVMKYTSGGMASSPFNAPRFIESIAGDVSGEAPLPVDTARVPPVPVQAPPKAPLLVNKVKKAQDAKMASEEAEFERTKKRIAAAVASGDLTPEQGKMALGNTFGVPIPPVRAPHEGNIRETSPGSGVWTQDLYDDAGKVISTIPASAPASASPSNAQLKEVYNPVTRRTEWQAFNPETRSWEPVKGGPFVPPPPQAPAAPKGPSDIQMANAQERFASSFERYAKEARIQQRWGKVLDTIWKEVESKPNASQTALVTIFNKMIDPLSVVRESEYARYGAGQPMWDRVEGYFQKLKAGGQGLSLAQAKELYQVGKQIALAANEDLLNKARRTRVQANTAKVDLKGVLTPDVLDILDEFDGLEAAENALRSKSAGDFVVINGKKYAKKSDGTIVVVK